jgi:N-acetylglutamate synthase-like GNAT family acetyltransferase
MTQAQTAGIDRLYLYTPDQAGFYSKLGWSILEKRQHLDLDVTIMQVKLDV